MLDCKSTVTIANENLFHLAMLVAHAVALPHLRRVKFVATAELPRTELCENRVLNQYTSRLVLKVYLLNASYNVTKEGGAWFFYSKT